MSISISIAKPLADIQGLSNIVLSAFAPDAQPKRSSQLSDSLDTSSADNCQKSLLSVIEAQIIPQFPRTHQRKRTLSRLRQPLLGVQHLGAHGAKSNSARFDDAQNGGVDQP